MSFYEIVYILTNMLYIFAIYKAFQIFFYEKTCNKKMKIIILLAYFIGLSLIIFITRWPIIMLVLNLFFLFAISLTYKSSFQKKMLSISSIYSIILIIELFSVLIFGFFDLSGTKDSTINSASILIFTRIITLVLVYLMHRYINALRKEYTIPKIYYLAYFLVLFGSLYLFTFGLSNENITLNHIIISGAILITVNVTMILIDEKIYNAIIMEHEQNILRQHNVALENQMEIINQSTEAIRLLKHDFKNHLTMLSNLYMNEKQEEIQPYINAVLGNIENDVFSNSGNFIIDSIINFKLQSIKNSNVKLAIRINVPITINILAHDLTAILGNLLDNAITACKKSDEKILEIKIRSKMDNLIILINNSYDGKIINKNRKLKTRKNDKDKHGLGITSIKKTLEKYGGEIRIDYTSNMFSVSIVIPY